MKMFTADVFDDHEQGQIIRLLIEESKTSLKSQFVTLNDAALLITFLRKRIDYLEKSRILDEMVDENQAIGLYDNSVDDFLKKNSELMDDLAQEEKKD